MAAPLKNKYWQLRKTHGRPTAFKTPLSLWKAACKYFKFCDDNPWVRKECIKSGEKAGTTFDVETMIPYTIKGFQIHSGVCRTYLTDLENSCQPKDGKKQTKRQKDFADIIACVKDVIYTHKFEGASAGHFNPSIIARDLGLVEQQDIKSAGQQIKSIAPIEWLDA
jgi:hypothetical protein